jgi:hypothetical protein
MVSYRPGSQHLAHTIDQEHQIGRSQSQRDQSCGQRLDLVIDADPRGWRRRKLGARSGHSSS